MTEKINSLIGSDISIVGNVFFTGTVHLDASVDGSLVADKSSKSKLYINNKSKVKGYVEGTYLAINGTVYGNIYAYDLLQLGSDALIKGDVYYKSIEMEVGAKIDGRLIVCDSAEELDVYKIDIESKGNSNTIT